MLKLFFYFTDKSKLTLGGTFTNEIRQGGDIYLLNNQYADTNHFYKEQNDIKRVTTQLKFDHKLNEKSSLTVRNSFNNFQRALEITPSKALQQYRFSGQQLSTFSEVAYTFRQKENVLITGLNFYSDNFWEDSLQSSIMRNEEYKTIGTFANYVFDIGKKLSIYEI